MTRFIVVSIGCGVLFGILDGVLNANPLARRLFEVYAPIARKKLNLPAGLLIDLIYGFVLGAFFILVRDALPGQTALVKGLGFAVLVWTFRVLMATVSQWMTFAIGYRTVLYSLLAGLLEMLVLGAVLGLGLGA